MMRLSGIASQLNCLPTAEMWQVIRSRFDSCQNKISDEAVEGGVGSACSKKVRNPEQNLRGPWYLASGFLLFWVLLFFAVVMPLFYRLPKGLTIEDASKGVFIAERAHNNLYEFDEIGTKVVGSDGNENKTVDYLLGLVAKIQENVLDEFFDIEVDLQEVSGSYIHWTMINKYQGVQNIVIKLSPKNTTSESYLLVNSHFDSKPTSRSAGDAGQMIVAILEVLRVMSTTRQTFRHPIVFLLNGAEENPLQASHGFITQHKWAKNCKGLINLDSAGGGGKEILFQSGPNHSWLMKYYKNYAKHPMATTMAEEIFQTGILPSDTDFSIFVKYGKLIGLDIAQFINGYTYHTKYDRFANIPRESIQNTGENLLSLVRALSNATELDNTAAYATGHAVFFDFLGLYFINYTESTGIILNYSVAGAALILIFVSIWRTASISCVSTGYVLCWFILILVFQVIAFVLGLVLPIAIAYAFDKFGLSLTYFSTPALMIGLYICPSLLGLVLPSYIYLKLQRSDKVPFAQRLQLVLHGHAVVLAILGIGLTLFGLRSAYVVTWTLIFYVVPLVINLLTTLHDRGFSWTGVLKIFQIIPFLYNSYLIYTFVVTLTSMMGRFGRSTNPDLIISALNGLGTILAMGFLIPLVNMFRRPSLIMFSLLVVSALTIYTATSTQIGFPYRPKTNVERVPYLHVRRTFYEYDGTVVKDDSGYLFNFQDRRGPAPLKMSKANLTGLVSIAADCDKIMMCGMPLYDHRWVKNQKQIMWLPREELINPPYVPELELLGKTELGNNTVRLEFRTQTTDHSSVFIKPHEDVSIVNWSFDLAYIGQQTTYHIYFSYGKNKAALTFFIDLWKQDGDFNVPMCQIGLSAHFIGDKGDASSQKFASLLPSFAALVEWPTSYQRFIY
ncbi:endoplasmic reticulum metallopeptidase 1-like isoform X1 [Drosophila elegans]|uniref:endoplasmic reticulum metallopeptidase 1-like isoform X1 n=1 Tax=Drosophila elegans TaxID=30023 RepID=UPI001BC84273|nr:endoplasmic reticulum metallopeptidase 1-like isoform X1 [Drosophila elegans]